MHWSMAVVGNRFYRLKLIENNNHVIPPTISVSVVNSNVVSSKFPVSFSIGIVKIGTIKICKVGHYLINYSNVFIKEMHLVNSGGRKSVLSF